VLDTTICKQTQIHCNVNMSSPTNNWRQRPINLRTSVLCMDSVGPCYTLVLKLIGRCLQLFVGELMFTLQCICVCLHIVVSNTYCVVFCFFAFLRLVASFTELFIFDHFIVPSVFSILYLKPHNMCWTPLYVNKHKYTVT
jgi:hypothetical protein